MSLTTHLGEILALLTALVWATAVVFFKLSGEKVHPLALNLFKNSFALVLFIPTLYIFGYTLIRDVPAWEYWALFGAGAVGIGIADWFFFMSLNRLGAGMTSIVDCLYSPFIIALSILWWDESLTGWQALGAFLIVSAVLTATRYKGDLSQRELWIGVILGALAMALNGFAIVSIKPVLARSPLIWLTILRLSGGIAANLLILGILPSRRKILGTLRTKGFKRYTLIGSFLGTYVALLLWLGGMKYTQMSVASALNQTSNVFLYIFAGVFLKEKLNWKMTVGIMLGLGGAFMVLFG